MELITGAKNSIIDNKESTKFQKRENVDMQSTNHTNK